MNHSWLILIGWCDCNLTCALTASDETGMKRGLWGHHGDRGHDPPCSHESNSSAGPLHPSGGMWYADVVITSLRSISGSDVYIWDASRRGERRVLWSWGVDDLATLERVDLWGYLWRYCATQQLSASKHIPSVVKPWKCFGAKRLGAQRLSS